MLHFKVSLVFRILFSLVLIFSHANGDNTSEEEEREEREINPVVVNPDDSTKLVLPKGYNRLAIPMQRNGPHGFRQVALQVGLDILSIPEIDEQMEELVLEVDLALTWLDWKLLEFYIANNATDPETGKPLRGRNFDSEALKQLWKPDIFFEELQSVKRTKILASPVQLKVHYYDGYILYRGRMKLTLKCDMDFRFYPADTQNCTYHILSYTYPIERLILKWSKFKTTKNNPNLLEPYDPNFDLQISNVKPIDDEYFVIEGGDPYEQSNFSSLQFSIKARRRLSYHLVQTYLPSVLLIMITWLCFLLPGGMVEARIGISMTTVLALTAMFAAVRQQSPKVSYSMAIDVWMVFNIFVVFVALLLFIIIYWMKLRLIRKQQAINEKNADDILDEDMLPIETYRTVVMVTKRYAFWAFAITFVLFFIGYWTWLLSASEYFEWDPSPENNNLDGETPGNVPGEYILNYSQVWSIAQKKNKLYTF